MIDIGSITIPNLNIEDIDNIEYVANVEADKRILEEKLKIYEKYLLEPKIISKDQEKEIYGKVNREETIRKQQEKDRLEQEIKQTNEYQISKEKRLKEIKNDIKRMNRDYYFNNKMYQHYLKYKNSPIFEDCHPDKPIKPPQTIKEYLIYDEKKRRRKRNLRANQKNFMKLEM